MTKPTMFAVFARWQMWGLLSCPNSKSPTLRTSAHVWQGPTKVGATRKARKYKRRFPGRTVVVYDCANDTETEIQS